MKNNIPILRVILLTVIISGIGLKARGQNVAVTDDDGYNAHPSAMLDVKSLTRGLLMPRMTTAQRIAISSPATGLIVFDTDFGRFFYYTGSVWVDNSAEGIWAKSGSLVRLGSSGDYVGLGTSSPLHKLHVFQNVVNTAGTDGNFIDIQNYNDASGVMSGLRLGNSTSTSQFKGGLFYQRTGTYGRGDMIFANDPIATTSNVNLGDARMIIKSAGNVEILGNPGGAIDDPLFEVKNKDGEVVLGVYNEGVRINVDDSGAKGSKGGFAVGGFNPLKGPTDNYLWIDPDSVRVYVSELPEAKGSKGGFAVGGFNPLAKGGPAVTLTHLTRDNYFIGHESGINITSGLYNTFFGYGAGRSNTSGERNVFIGYKSGYAVQTSSYNVYIGHQSGYNSTGGFNNVYVGDGAGENNTTGDFNTFIGFQAGQNTGLSSYNTAIGYQAGRTQDQWQGGVFIGWEAGTRAEGQLNCIIGTQAGDWVTDGARNVMLGSYAGANHSDLANTGNENVFIGQEAGSGYLAGQRNVYLGYCAGQYATGSNNVFIGAGPGASTSISNQLIIRQNNYELIKGDFSAATINLNGNVGMGHTLVPSVTLDVRGTGARIWDGSATVNYATSTGDLYVEDVLEVDNDMFVTDYVSAMGGVNVGGTADPGSSNLIVAGSAAVGITSPGSHKMHINSSGVLYAASTLHVTNTSTGQGLGLTVEANGSDNSVLFTQKGTGNIFRCDTYTGGWKSVFTVNNTGKLIAPYLASSGTGNYLRWNTSTGEIYQYPSSIRYKKAVRDLDFSMDLFNQLRPVSFEWKESGGKDYGLIAEEVEEMDPSLVNYNKDGQPEGVDYHRVNMMLLKVVQDQQATIEKLEKRITKLEDKVN